MPGVSGEGIFGPSTSTTTGTSESFDSGLLGGGTTGALPGVGATGGQAETISIDPSDLVAVTIVGEIYIYNEPKLPQPTTAQSGETPAGNGSNPAAAPMSDQQPQSVPESESAAVTPATTSTPPTVPVDAPSNEKPEEKVVLAGTANLTRFRQDFSAQIHPFLEALEEQVVLLRLLGGASNGVQVRIGSEQSEENLKETSVISVGYGEVGALGVIGPTRMDYASSMAAVSAVANYVSRYLQENA